MCISREWSSSLIFRFPHIFVHISYTLQLWCLKGYKGWGGCHTNKVAFQGEVHVNAHHTIFSLYRNLPFHSLISKISRLIKMIHSLENINIVHLLSIKDPSYEGASPLFRFRKMSSRAFQWYMAGVYWSIEHVIFHWKMIEPIIFPTKNGQCAASAHWAFIDKFTVCQKQSHI